MGKPSGRLLAEAGMAAVWSKDQGWQAESVSLSDGRSTPPLNPNRGPKGGRGIQRHRLQKSGAFIVVSIVI